MPFLARCRNCNYLIYAEDSHELIDGMLRHLSRSHGYPYEPFTLGLKVSHFSDLFEVSRIWHKTYRAISVASKSSRFWHTYRNARKIILP